MNILRRRDPSAAQGERALPQGGALFLAEVEPSRLPGDYLASSSDQNP